MDSKVFLLYYMLYYMIYLYPLPESIYTTVITHYYRLPKTCPYNSDRNKRNRVGERGG